MRPSPCDSSHKRQTVLFVVGPTASGKTALAALLARKLNGEVISCDSMQVYRGMDIGTAKPSRTVLRRVKHHLIDICKPSQSFSVYAYRRHALAAIRDVLKRGKLPIVAGGSGLYYRALIRGLDPAPGRNAALRKKLKAQAQKHGLGFLYQKLRRFDHERAAKIKPTDRQRILRALEIVLSPAKTLARTRAAQDRKSLRDGHLEPVVIGLRVERAALYQAIEKRVDRMFRRGLLREARALRKRRLSQTASQALGYKQILQALPDPDLPQLKALIKRATRRFAKRQMTWFRKEPEIRWISVLPGEPPSRIWARIRSALTGTKEIGSTDEFFAGRSTKLRGPLPRSCAPLASRVSPGA